MRVTIGSDHAGLSLKQHLVQLLRDWGHEVEDLGTHGPASVDYPDYAAAVGRRVLEAGGLGVLVCGSGIGMSIAANKIAGIRAARCDEPYSARLAREHNDANVLCLGERVIGQGVAGDTLRAFMDGVFAGGRHARRVEQLRRLEEER